LLSWAQCAFRGYMQGLTKIRSILDGGIIDVCRSMFPAAG